MVSGNPGLPLVRSMILILALLSFADVVRAWPGTSADKKTTSATDSDGPKSGGRRVADQAPTPPQPTQQKPGNPAGTPGATEGQKPGPPGGTPGATEGQKPGRPAGTPGLLGEPGPVPSFEVSGTYNYVRLAGLNCHGGSGSIAYNVNDSVGAVAEVGGCRDTGLPSGISGHAVTYLFGPRINFRSSSKFTPYGQLLVGGAQFGGTGGVSANAFAMTLGGGLDLRISDHVSFRVAQAEYLLTQFGGTQQNNFRFQSGIVLRFGSK